ncbi:MAG TPA: methyltransferase domain-containing protein [Thermoanaerobaculia bacterium]|nr:methyltransferase domain-containing protein [Thermoanaerobaculia bacterium]
MKTEQQEQALEFFRRFASDWRRRAEGGELWKVNVIRQRNEYVLEVVRRKGDVRRFLDVGCGSGELVCDVAALGASAEGVDFAPEMVELGRNLAQQRKLESARFACASVFDYEPEGRPLDLIAANGFIEYFSRSELLELLSRMRSWLAPGGSLVVGSRNRLFNLFSLNDYSRLERRSGALEPLLGEAIEIAGAETWANALDALRRCKALLPEVGSHPITGVEVATRHQYTPAELVARCENANFEVVELRPIHYHAAPPGFARRHPEIHVATAELFQENAAGEPALLPFSSSFMVHAVAR